VFRTTIFGCLALTLTAFLSCTQSQPVQRLGAPPAAAPATIDTIAFGSCLKAQRDAPVFSDILAADPDLMLMIGDNVYVDLPDIPQRMRDFTRKYQELAAQPYWQALRARVPVLATWDDHDYGLNDAGKNWRMKDEAKAAFLDFFEIPEDARVRQREGIYQVYAYGPPERRVQVILLDTRSFRDRLSKKLGATVRRGGPYKPTTDPDRELLGEAQWEWLERQLRKPAALRIVASSIQVVSEQHGWESWAKFPHERERLFKLLGQAGAEGVIFISGDRHVGEISRDAVSELPPYPVWDVTSSGLNEGTRAFKEANRHRVGGVFRTTNFGLIHIDWSRADPLITLSVVGLGGDPLSAETVRLSELQPAASAAGSASVSVSVSAEP
jgi:alkaline phosphatase D